MFSKAGRGDLLSQIKCSSDIRNRVGAAGSASPVATPAGQTSRVRSSVVGSLINHEAPAQVRTHRGSRDGEGGCGGGGGVAATAAASAAAPPAGYRTGTRTGGSLSIAPFGGSCNLPVGGGGGGGTNVRTSGGSCNILPGGGGGGGYRVNGNMTPAACVSTNRGTGGSYNIAPPAGAAGGCGAANGCGSWCQLLRASPLVENEGALESRCGMSSCIAEGPVPESPPSIGRRVCTTTPGPSRQVRRLAGPTLVPQSPSPSGRHASAGGPMRQASAPVMSPWAWATAPTTHVVVSGVANGGGGGGGGCGGGVTGPTSAREGIGVGSGVGGITAGADSGYVTRASSAREGAAIGGSYNGSRHSSAFALSARVRVVGDQRQQPSTVNNRSSFGMNRRQTAPCYYGGGGGNFGGGGSGNHHGCGGGSGGGGGGIAGAGCISPTSAVPWRQTHVDVEEASFRQSLCESPTSPAGRPVAAHPGTRSRGSPVAVSMTGQSCGGAAGSQSGFRRNDAARFHTDPGINRLGRGRTTPDVPNRPQVIGSSRGAHQNSSTARDAREMQSNVQAGPELSSPPQISRGTRQNEIRGGRKRQTRVRENCFGNGDEAGHDDGMPPEAAATNEFAANRPHGGDAQSRRRAEASAKMAQAEHRPTASAEKIFAGPVGLGDLRGVNFGGGGGGGIRGNWRCHGSVSVASSEKTKDYGSQPGGAPSECDSLPLGAEWSSFMQCQVQPTA